MGIDNPRMDIAGVRGPDEWEDWCRWRDRSAREGVSARYVSADTIGYGDLDELGPGAMWSSTVPFGASRPRRLGAVSRRSLGLD